MVRAFIIILHATRINAGIFTTHTYARARPCVRARARAHTHTHTHARTHTHAHAHTHTHTRRKRVPRGKRDAAAPGAALPSAAAWGPPSVASRGPCQD